MFRIEQTQNQIHRHLTSSQVIILGYFSVILLGTLLLTLPFATADGKGAAATDAVFTATSALCVTGLVIHDTATYWSPFGQLIILLLIQTGGMGVVTVAATITVFSGKKIGLMQRSTMQEAIAAPQVGGIVRMTEFIIKATILMELIGAAVMAPVFCGEFGLGKGLWYALFHSVSAFCNAGFDLFGVKAPFSSLTSYSAQPVINITVAALIIIGGIGFLTWEDIKKNKWRLRKYRMQSKVILAVTAGLILLPTVYFFFCEFSALSPEERVLSSLFQSISPRTAGFNTVDLTKISETGQMLTILLMLIGGSPGSTAGGMKTTTIAVLCASALTVFRQKGDPHFFGYRISDRTVKNAATVLLMYFTLFIAGAMVISAVDDVPLLSALYETASAIGTVGLSLGITSELGTVSRLILVLLMFLGRVGGLTLVFAAFTEKPSCGGKYPQGKITVG